MVKPKEFMLVKLTSPQFIRIYIIKSPVKINKHIVNLICRKCGLSCAIWENDLVNGPVTAYTDADRELLK